MSSLSSLFNRGLLGARCKTCLNLAISRIKHLRNKREAQLANMRKEICQFLQTGQESIARIRVEHVIREQNILSAYEIIELFCEFVLARVPVLDNQKSCPSELLEAIATIIFAAPRCSDVPELMQIRNLLSTKYGKEFVSSASELRPDSGVNRVIIEKLSIKAPSTEIRLAFMKAIAQEYGFDWDSSLTEAEFAKKHEDLLDGINPVTNEMGQMAEEKFKLPTPVPRNSDAPVQLMPQSGSERGMLPTAIIKAEENKKQPAISQLKQMTLDDDVPSVNHHLHDDVLETARTAIAVAERACMAARTAANLVNARVACQIGVSRPDT